MSLLMKHTLTISLIVNNFFSLVLLLSLSFCNNHLDFWVTKNNSKIINSDILSIQFNMVRYNKVNPFKKLKDKKSYQFIIDRSSRFHLQANDMISIFNGDTLVSYNKKSKQSFILNHDSKVINSIVGAIFDFDVQDYEFIKINDFEYDFSFDDNVNLKVFFNDSSKLIKIIIIHKKTSIDITDIVVDKYIGRNPFDLSDIYKSDIFDLTK